MVFLKKTRNRRSLRSCFCDRKHNFNMERKIISTTICDKSISENLGIDLNNQRKKGEFCDFILQTKDGGAFPVHKVVINAKSSYFQTMFNSGFKNKDSNELTFEKFESNVLEKIIEYMYTGRIEITSDNAADILDFALYLGLFTLVYSCTQILIQSINMDNCFKLLKYSETYENFCGEELQNKCIQFLMKNLNDLKESSDFLQISFEILKKLLLIERDYNEEETFFLTIMQWILYDHENREKYFEIFLNYIKFDCMSDEFCSTKILKNNQLLDNPSLFGKIVSVLGKKLVKNVECASELNNERDGTKAPNRFSNYENLYKIDGNDKLYSYDWEKKDFTKFIANKFNSRNFKYTTFGEKNIFACGGGIVGGILENVCEYFPMKNYFEKNETAWKGLPSMRIARENHSVVTINDNIYVIGGKNENRVEVFNTNKMKWSWVPSLFGKARENTISCSFNNCIYTFSKREVQFLDPRERFWSRIILDEYLTVGDVISFNNMIYVFTGNCIYEFDPRFTSQSLVKHEHNKGISNIRVCTIDKKIYIAYSYALNSIVSYKQHIYDKTSDLVTLSDENSLPDLKNNIYVLLSM